MGRKIRAKPLPTPLQVVHRVPFKIRSAPMRWRPVLSLGKSATPCATVTQQAAEQRLSQIPGLNLNETLRALIQLINRTTGLGDGLTGRMWWIQEISGSV